MRKKILEMCPYMNLGGTEKHLLTLAKELAGRFELVIAAPRGPARGDFENYGFQMVDYPEALSISPRKTVTVIKQVESLIQKERPHLVHVHAAREMLAMVRLVDRAIPLVFTPHAYTSSFDFVTTSLFARLADRVICVSDWEKIRLDKFLGARAGTLTVRIYNGIPMPGGPDDEIPARAPCGRPPDSITLGCVARLHKAKGIDVLVRAFAGLLPECPGLELVIVGDGQEREGMDRLASKLGVRCRVRFTGGLARPMEEVKNWDIFVLPSFKETLPIAIIEAMSLGKPVISTTVGGIPEVVQHGQTGLLCRPGDVSQLKEAIRTLVRSPGMRAGFGEKARERARELFSASRMAEMTAGVYEETIAMREACSH